MELNVGLTNATPLRGASEGRTMVEYQQGPNRANLSQMSLYMVMTYCRRVAYLCVTSEFCPAGIARAPWTT